MSLSDYLAKNYLNPTKKKEKKKEKEHTSEKRESSVIVDHQLLSSSRAKKLKISKDEGDDVVANRRDSPFSPKSAGNKGWKVVGTDEVVQMPREDSSKETPKMESGANAGLQTGAQVAQQIRLKEEADRKEMEKLKANNETVYRDESGKRVNIHQIREDQKREKENAELERENRLKEMNMGLVQKLMQEKAIRKLQSAKTSSLSTYADDEKLNAELKQRELEDDPLLSFSPSKSKKYVSLTGRKLYRGGFPENRFGIVPGHRWDGVDRSNGFEARWFKNQVEREEKKILSYTMQDEY